MKAGLRLQILMLLGVLLIVAFVPLYLAISTYTGVALSQAHTKSARSLALTTNQLLVAQLAAGTAPQAAINALFQGEHNAVSAVVCRQHATGRKFEHGDPAPLKLFSTTGSGEQLLGNGHWLAQTTNASGFSLTTIVTNRAPRGAVLNRFLALYMALVALALLLGTHFTLTRWIIQPVTELSLAAKRVLTSTSELQVPSSRSRELSELGQSLKLMTRRLLEEKEALRLQVLEVELATEKLKQAQGQLIHSERLASVGQLAAGFAHEIGNPIAAISGMLDLQLNDDLEAELRLDFTKRMRKETERINRILQDLLQFARPNSNNTAELARGNVEAAVTETVTLISTQPALSDVALAIDIFPDLPLVAMSHDHLTQILLNLLMNAAHACHSGGHITIRAKSNNGDVILVVEDDGPGVAEEVQTTIFEPFVSSKEVGEGTGLGLSVCKGLVEAAGGSLKLDLLYSEGARFVTVLPPFVEAAAPT